MRCSTFSASVSAPTSSRRRPRPTPPPETAAPACNRGHPRPRRDYPRPSVDQFDRGVLGRPVEVWEQCGGDGWTGSTCYEEDLMCAVRARALAIRR